jgi:hypothetical protein
MRVRARAFQLPKAGNSVDEYEDACWPERSAEREARVFRCAVADGATETSFAASWARLLVRSYCRSQLSPRSLPRHLPRLRASWKAIACSRPLPWYAEEKLRSGAYSALAGLSVREDAGGLSWSACSVGDCCLFQVRGDELLTSFPLAGSTDFTSRPHLLSSIPNGGESTLATAFGSAAHGDHFLLMTDALSAWFLASHEAGEQPWRKLYCSDAFDGGPFECWIDRMRMEKKIRNDDVTLLTLHIT